MGRGALAQERSLSDSVSCSGGLLGPGPGHPGDRACPGRAAAPRPSGCLVSPLPRLQGLACQLGPAVTWEVTGRGEGWFQSLMKATETRTKHTGKGRTRRGASCRVAGVIGLVPQVGRWRQRQKHPHSKRQSLRRAACAGAPRPGMVCRNHAFGFLSFKQQPLPERAVHLGTQEAWCGEALTV